MPSVALKKAVFEKTSGCCHFCGDPLTFEKYGWNREQSLDGVWEIDHVIQKWKGGSKNAENCLPTCVRCNRLRWNRKGDNLREIIFLGLIAKDQIKKNSDVGKRLKELRMKRIIENNKRRKITERTYIEPIPEI